MTHKTLAILCLISLALTAFPLSGSAADATEVYVVAADSYGVSNYLPSLGNGTLSTQEPLGQIAASVTGYSFGGALGDFDNDGDFDYVTTKGYLSGSLIVFEKVAPYNVFSARTVAAWKGGMYPTGMTAADFNEDGNQDVVLSYLGSGNCTLFLGDGTLGFSVASLPNTAAVQSVGVDAADVNNDGHMDFVTAPYTSRDRFFVNLGNGDGTFNSYSFTTYTSTGYWGLAVADFDNDGNADLAASYSNYVDLYRGNGDGTFVWLNRITDSNFYYCSLDNFDFDGDGIQDLVMGRYNNSAPYYAQGVALFRGNGDWTFTYVGLFLGGQGWERSTIAAPNAIAKNLEPVAAIQPADGPVEAGSPVLFDGSASHDQDGQIAAYQWEFGDGQTSSQASAEHIYYTAGTYEVKLTVTDDKGATGSSQTQITVKAIAVAVSFDPQTLNLKEHDRFEHGRFEHGRFVQARLQLPAECGDLVIDAGSVYLTVGDTNVPAARVKGLTAKFDRQAIIDGIDSTSDAMVLPVYGKVNRNGGLADFEGSGTIRTIDPGRAKQHGQSHRWHSKVREVKYNPHDRYDSHDQHNPGKQKR
jgi:PKD domain/FG-GAP-like repeat